MGELAQVPLGSLLTWVWRLYVKMMERPASQRSTDGSFEVVLLLQVIFQSNDIEKHVSVSWISQRFYGSLRFEPFRKPVSAQTITLELT